MFKFISKKFMFIMYMDIAENRTLGELKKKNSAA